MILMRRNYLFSDNLNHSIQLEMRACVRVCVCPEDNLGPVSDHQHLWLLLKYLSRQAEQK